MAKNISLRKAKFFCENCGEEVPQNAKFCSKCGKFFSFVRCPKCFYTGDSKKFTTGCPKCGYAVKPYESMNGAKRGNNTNNFSLSSFLGSSQSSHSKAKNYDSSLPIWIYVVTISVLVAVVFGLYSCL